MRRRTAGTITAALIALLVLSVVAQIWVLPAMASSVTEVFPEVKLLTVPGITWGVLAIGCWQGIAMIGLRLVSLTRDQGWNASIHEWLRAMICFLAAFIVLAASAFIALSVMEIAPPAIMLGLLASGFIALIAVGALGLFLSTRPLLPSIPTVESAPNARIFDGAANVR